MNKIEKRAAMALIMNGEKVLTVSRKDNPNDRGLPGGKCEDWETFKECVVREVKEETGLDVFVVRFLFSREEKEFEGRTYLCLPIIGSSVEIETKEAGVVKWGDWQELFDGSFGGYNKELYDHLVKEDFFKTQWIKF